MVPCCEPVSMTGLMSQKWGGCSMGVGIRDALESLFSVYNVRLVSVCGSLMHILQRSSSMTLLLSG